MRKGRKTAEEREKRGLRVTVVSCRCSSRQRSTSSSEESERVVELGRGWFPAILLVSVSRSATCLRQRARHRPDYGVCQSPISSLPSSPPAHLHLPRPKLATTTFAAPVDEHAGAETECKKSKLFVQDRCEVEENFAGSEVAETSSSFSFPLEGDRINSNGRSLCSRLRRVDSRRYSDRKKPVSLSPRSFLSPPSRAPCPIHRVLTFDIPRPQPSLPTELINWIFFLTDDKTTAACCLVSSAFLPCARRRLYHSFTFSLWCTFQSERFIASAPSTYRLFQTLALPENAHLCALIQDVSFLFAEYDDEYVNETEFMKVWQEEEGVDGDTYPDDYEGEGIWELVERYDVGHGALANEVVLPIIRNLKSAKSVYLNLPHKLPRPPVDDLWEVFQTLPRLEKLRVDCGVMRCWKEPVLEGFPALKKLRVEVDFSTKGDEEQLRKWRCGRGIEYVPWGS